MLNWISLAILLTNLSGCVISDERFCNGPAGDRWFKFRDHCYQFHTGEGNLRSYYDAEDFCRSKGSHLVSIHSDEENQFLSDILETYYYSNVRMWIGLNILQGPETYEWSDEQPFNYHKIVPKTLYRKESCFAFQGRNGNWRQEHCEMTYYPICKRVDSGVTPTPLPPFTPTVPEGNCPNGWIQFGHRCYKFFGADETDRLNFKDAKKACISLGENHDLVSIHSMEEQAFLTQQLYEFRTAVWIGFTYVNSDIIGHGGVFGWTDNTRANFTYWAPAYRRNGFLDCTYLNVEGHGKGYWMAEMCEFHKHGYICQRPPDEHIPEKIQPVLKCDDNSYVKFRDSCYRYYSEERSWEEAERTCKENGGHLVSVTDAFEQSFLYGFLSSKPQSLWIGLKNIKNTRIFRWASGEPLYYSNWAESQPDLSHVEASCVSSTTENVLQWNATTCDVQRPFICEISKGNPHSLIEDVIGDCPTFESSWIDIGDNYCYHQGQGKYSISGWGNNIHYCFSRGMEMISLHSEHQMKSLISYFWKGRYDCWLNLIRTFDRKSFIWVDGSRFNYSNWADNEPGRLSAENDCVSISVFNLKWKPTGCSNGMNTLCRIKKIPRGSVKLVYGSRKLARSDNSSA